MGSFRVLNSQRTAGPKEKEWGMPTRKSPAVPRDSGDKICFLVVADFSFPQAKCEQETPSFERCRTEGAETQLGVAKV